MNTARRQLRPRWSRILLRSVAACSIASALAACVPDELIFVPETGTAGASGNGAGAGGESTAAGRGGSTAGSASGGRAGAAGTSGGGTNAGGSGGGAGGLGGFSGSAGSTSPGGAAGTAGQAGQAGAAGTGTAGQAGQAGAGGQAGGGAGGLAGMGGQAGSGGAAGTSGGTCTGGKRCVGDDLYTCNAGDLELLTPCPAFGCAPVLATCSTKCRVGSLTCTGPSSFERCLETGNGFETGFCMGASLCNETVGACTACVVDADCGGAALEALGFEPTCVAKAPTCLPNGTCSVVGPSDVVPSGTDVTPSGDCKVRICDGAGKGTLVTDDTDQPPGDRCAPNTVCQNGALVPTPKLRGAICNGGAGRCDGLSACVGARSCAGMAAGPVSRGSEMCAVARVNGGAFVLNKTTTVDATAVQAPHVVGDFWVDRYEVTVGRFRRFIAGFDAWRDAGNPASMGGYDSKLRPYEGDDPCIGWDQHDYVPACAASLEARVSTETLTWTAAPEFTSQGFPLDERPMIGGLPWALARAFCLWDGGRLPTYAEHFYLKAQGSEQRDAPWLAPPSAMTDATVTDACWSDGLGTNPVLDVGGNVTRYALPCLVGGYCASGPSNDLIVNRNSDTFGAARFRDISLGVSATAVYDLAGSAAEWMLDASVPYATDGSPCVDCVRARPWSVTGGRATLGYNWRTGYSTTVAASVKRQGDSLCAKGTQTMGFRCVYTDRGDEAPLAPAACVTGHANAAPLGAADCDGASGAGGGYTSLCP